MQLRADALIHASAFCSGCAGAFIVLPKMLTAVEQALKSWFKSNEGISDLGITEASVM